MPIPGFQTMMLPLLTHAGDGEEHSTHEAIDSLAATFGLSSEERSQLLPSGQQTSFANRVNWCVTHLKKAGLLSATRQSHYRITDRGVAVLARGVSHIDNKFLEQFPEFVEFRTKRNPVVRSGPSGPVSLSPLAEAAGEETTPEEAIEAAYQRIRNDLATNLLQQIMSCSAAFFERLVVDLLLRMGYGGTRRDAGEAIGRSGDGGIDGIIKEDRLGLDVIYIQAKRWEGTVGRPEIQKFVGALQGQRARKGVFITTSSFSSEATQYSGLIDTKVVLIDGDLLAQLMIDHGVGVTPAASYEIKKVDSDYFTDD